VSDQRAERNEIELHEQEKATTAAALERRVKASIAGLRQGWVELAGHLYHFWRINGWEALGHRSVGEWLADPQIGLSRSTAYRFKEAYRELVVHRGIDPERLGQIDMTKIVATLPAVRREQVEPERAIADAEALTWRDLQERYSKLPATTDVDGRPIEPDDFVVKVCDYCGSTYQEPA
jgi:hypothetical protein